MLKNFQVGSLLPNLRQECRRPESNACQFVNKYIRLFELRSKRVLKKKSKKASNNLRIRNANSDEDLQIQYLPNDYYKSNEETTPPKLQYLTTGKYKRISPVFLKMLNLHPAFEEPLRKPLKVMPKAAFEDPTALDVINPRLANFFRKLMEQNPLSNCLYGIDFYNNYDIDEINAMIALNRINNDIAYLLYKIEMGMGLRSFEVNKLLEFLQALGHLNSTKIVYFLQKLQQCAAFTPQTIAYLLKLLAKGATSLTSLQIKLVSNELKTFEQRSKKLHPGDRTSLKIAIGKILAMRRNQKRVEFEFERERERESNRLSSNRLSNRVSLEFYNNPAIMSDTAVALPRRMGETKFGYVEPWDTLFPWDTNGKLPGPSISSEILYTRGMEYYLSNKQTKMEMTISPRNSSYGSLVVPLSEPAESQIFLSRSKTSIRSNRYLSRSVRRLPAFMKPVKRKALLKFMKTNGKSRHSN